jgi:glycogen operon protein
MTSEEWSDPFARCVGALFTAAGLDERDKYGRRMTDEDFLLLLNAHYEPIDFKLPENGAWLTVVDTARDPGTKVPSDVQQERYVIEGRSLALLCRAST